MRLINTETLELHEFFESQAPPYAILSHTWEKDEIPFQEMLSKSPSTIAKAGYRKIQDTCRLAQSRGRQWAWIDTCCIDKSSSAELTESINSMYRWYQKAEECYAYLVDYTPRRQPEVELGKCRWFTRGFTLQELIAPKLLILFDRDWNSVGEKGDEHIMEIINRITRISKDVLLFRKPPSDFAIAERMLWASTRETTRPEDKAYCLLGIFEVNMPLIYGEGENAFRRLQEEIIKRSNDLSIFVWGTPLNFGPPKHDSSFTEDISLGLLASSPADFGSTWEHMGKGELDIIFPAKGGVHDLPEFTLTNKGLNIRPSIIMADIRKDEEGQTETYYTIYIGLMSKRPFAVLLEKVGAGLYVRLGVRISKLNETILTRFDGSPLAYSDTTNTILVDHRSLFKGKEAVFEHTLLIQPRSCPDVTVRRALPHTHWDASKALFFLPPRKVYGQEYEIACAEVEISFPETSISTLSLYVIIDIKYHPIRAFVLGKDDLPEIASLTEQTHIPRHVLFPVTGQARHLLNKGPEYGRQKMIKSRAHVGDPKMITISIETSQAEPPVVWQSALGRIEPQFQFAVHLHVKVDDVLPHQQQRSRSIRVPTAPFERKVAGVCRSSRA